MKGRVVVIYIVINGITKIMRPCSPLLDLHYKVDLLKSLTEFFLDCLKLDLFCLKEKNYDVAMTRVCWMIL